MIVFTIDDNGLIKSIAERLGEYHEKAPTVLSKAINATARKTNTLMKQAIRKKYAYSRTDKIKAAFKIAVRATKANPSATITVTSESQHLSDFKISPSSPSKGDYGAAKAMAFKKGNMTPIEGNGVKAFTAMFSNGKIAIVQRVPGERYKKASALAKRQAKYGKKADPTRIKAFFGSSIPKMAAKVHEESVADQTMEILQENVQKFIKKTVEAR